MPASIVSRDDGVLHAVVGRVHRERHAHRLRRRPNDERAVRLLREIAFGALARRLRAVPRILIEVLVVDARSKARSCCFRGPLSCESREWFFLCCTAVCTLRNCRTKVFSFWFLTCETVNNKQCVSTAFKVAKNKINQQNKCERTGNVIRRNARSEVAAAAAKRRAYPRRTTGGASWW